MFVRSCLINLDLDSVCGIVALWPDLQSFKVPKFLKDDLPLFENIISDLFPGAGSAL